MSAEQIISSATSAVTGELTRILFSGLVGRLDRQSSAAADKKLRRLESLDILVIKFHGAVEASEKHAIENTWLLKWRDTLKEAAAEGEQVLASFRQRQRAMDAPRGPGDDAHHDQDQEQEQEQEQSPSSSSTTASAATTKTPVFSGEDIQRLNSAVERLEELSPEIGTFLKLLKLEILTPDQRTTTENTESSVRGAKRKSPSARSGDGSEVYFDCLQKDAGIGALPHPDPSMNKVVGSVAQSWKPIDEMVEASREEKWRSTLLVDRLEEAFAVICRAVELADGRDMRDHEWLTYWASMLREAKGQGSAVLGAISARRSDIVVAINAAASEPEEDSELGRFVCGMETLAGDVDYFAGLACLCPSY